MPDGGGRTGTTIAGRYRIDERTGSLLQAELYRAEEADAGRTIIALVIDRQHVPTPEIAEAVVAELAEAGAGPHDPSLVVVADQGALEDGAVYAVLDAAGETSATTLVAGADSAPISWERLRTIIAGVLDGLVALHGAGRIHGAVGPEVVFVGDDRARLFPVSFRSLRESDAPTAPGLVMAAPEYMAPEQLTGATVDERADLYQLGCLIHALIAGAPPFQGETPVAIMTQHISGDVPDLPAGGWQEACPELDERVRTLLAKAPEDRFASAAEARAAILGPVAPPEGDEDVESKAAGEPIEPDDASEDQADTGENEADADARAPQVESRHDAGPPPDSDGARTFPWMAIAVVILIAGALAVLLVR